MSKSIDRFYSVIYNYFLMIKGKAIRLSERRWVEVEEEARKLGISVTAFLKLLIE